MRQVTVLPLSFSQRSFVREKEDQAASQQTKGKVCWLLPGRLSAFQQAQSPWASVTTAQGTGAWTRTSSESRKRRRYPGKRPVSGRRPGCTKVTGRNVSEPIEAPAVSCLQSRLHFFPVGRRTGRPERLLERCPRARSAPGASRAYRVPDIFHRRPTR